MQALLVCIFYVPNSTQLLGFRCVTHFYAWIAIVHLRTSLPASSFLYGLKGSEFMLLL
jgi:hypothetical protein